MKARKAARANRKSPKGKPKKSPQAASKSAAPPPEVVAAAQQTERETGVPASATLGQWALESGFGKHTPGNNPFGIKARDGQPYMLLWTKEKAKNGSGLVRVQQKFRKFDSLDEAFRVRGELLSKRYPIAMAHKDDPDAFVEGLQADPKHQYATDPNYASKVIGTMKRNNFYQYDLKNSGGSLTKPNNDASLRVIDGEPSVVLGTDQHMAAHVESPHTGGGKNRRGQLLGLRGEEAARLRPVRRHHERSVSSGLGRAGQRVDWLIASVRSGPHVEKKAMPIGAFERLVDGLDHEYSIDCWYDHMKAVLGAELDSLGDEDWARLEHVWPERSAGWRVRLAQAAFRAENPRVIDLLFELFEVPRGRGRRRRRRDAHRDGGRVVAGGLAAGRSRAPPEERDARRAAPDRAAAQALHDLTRVLPARVGRRSMDDVKRFCHRVGTVRERGRSSSSRRSACPCREEFMLGRTPGEAAVQARSIGQGAAGQGAGRTK
ncbi:MAG: glucosaminidase domain-containing protein [Minicystis sp.]